MFYHNITFSPTHQLICYTKLLLIVHKCTYVLLSTYAYISVRRK